MQKSRSDLLAPGWSAPTRPAAPALLWRVIAVWSDSFLGAGLALAAFALYATTLLPGVGSRDTAELQRVVPRLGLAHATGYPLYTILGWLWSQLPLGGTPAWRMNLFSAAAAALAIGVVYRVGRALGQVPLVAAAAALALATSLAFWSQATIAEVYSLAALLQALFILALLRWRAGAWPLWPAGLLLGLGLAHHRSIALMLPGALLFVLLAARDLGRGTWQRTLVPESRSRATSLKSQASIAAAAVLAACLLYLYVPLRAPAWMRTWAQVWEHISGAGLTATWLDPARLRAEGIARPLDLVARFVWPQLLPAGAILALLGAARLIRRDRALAALLIIGYLLVCAFCAAYYVADVEVFFIPAHLLAALLLGEGATWLILLVEGWQPKTKYQRPTTKNSKTTSALNRWPFVPRLPSYVYRPLSSVVRPSTFAGLALLILPALLFARNFGAVRALNTPGDERAARATMAQTLPAGALVIGNWASIESLRYLQEIEDLQPDAQFGTDVGRGDILAALEHGRAVYLAEPNLGLGLEQWPEGRLWRVGAKPIAADTTADIRWNGEIALAGYTLRHGPQGAAKPVPVLLRWQALGAPNRDYTLFVHLVAADGTIWAQSDAPPTEGPTSGWRPGARYADLISLALKPGAPAGRYRVTLGWYEYPSMARLGLADGSADYITLGEIEIAP